MKSDEKNGVYIFFDNFEVIYIFYDVICSYDCLFIMGDFIVCMVDKNVKFEFDW